MKMKMDTAKAIELGTEAGALIDAMLSKHGPEGLGALLGGLTQTCIAWGMDHVFASEYLDKFARLVLDAPLEVGECEALTAWALARVGERHRN